MTRPLLALLAVFAFGCADATGPAFLEKGRDLCGHCRMPVSDPHFAAQIVVDGELPLFFDEPGCLAGYVNGEAAHRKGVAWVADHRTGAWVRADRAVYTRVADLPTPMNHHLVAHENGASRDADPATRGGIGVASTEIFGPQGPPAGGL